VGIHASRKIFLGQLSCKIRAFSGVNTANFSGKNHVKFENFVNFSYIFSGKNVLPTKVY